MTSYVRTHFNTASRVDFFNDENNRRLEIHKKRKIGDMLPTVFKKEPVFVPQSIKKNSSSRLVRLIERIYVPELEKNEGEYVALNNHFIEVDTE